MTQKAVQQESATEKEVILYWVGPANIGNLLTVPKSTQAYPSSEGYLNTLENDLKLDGYNTLRIEEARAREIIRQRHKNLK